MWRTHFYYNYFLDLDFFILSIYFTIVEQQGKCIDF